jgi:peptidoglycan/xylan/chitin deacetylase (PgdA/CDA1 family)
MTGMPDVLVLCYHAVSPSWPAALSVTPERLHAQLRRLVRRGYRGVTFSQAFDGERAGKRLAVTFDDALRSVLDLAVPVLDQLGLTATVFVPTAFPDGDGPVAWPGVDHWLDGPHARELESMSWAQLRALAERGWEIGSHTVSHPRLTQLGDAALEAELVDSRRACEAAVEAPCTSIAYPYGDVDARVVAAARTTGYANGAALPIRPHRPRPLEWPRVGIYHVDSGPRFALKVSRSVRALRTARR